MRIRVKYSINGKIRFISHLDLMRAFGRHCTKKEIPVAVSQGFSPHLKISFGPPLSVGMTSSCEYLDMYFEQKIDLSWLKINLQDGLPEGIKIEDVFETKKEEPSLSVSLNRAEYILKDTKGKTLHITVPIGQNGNVRPIDELKKLYPCLSLDELKLWHIHRERLYNERNAN